MGPLSQMRRLIHAQLQLKAKHASNFVLLAREVMACESDLGSLLSAMDRGSLLVFQSSGMVSRRLKRSHARREQLRDDMQQEERKVARLQLVIERLEERADIMMAQSVQDEFDQMTEEWITCESHVS
jgi:hypothetical protein